MNDHSTRDRRLDTTALALFAVALVLYLPGIVWGLPYATSPDRIHPWGSDELAPLGPLAQVYHVVFHGGAAFDPRYPLLPYLIQAIFIAPYIGWLKLTGGLQGFDVEFPFGLADPIRGLAGMTVAARLSSLLMMAAVPAIAHRTARWLWDSRTAVFTGVFVLLLYPMWYYSTTSNVDAGGLFWTALGMLVFAASLRNGLTPRRAALLGVFAACATATKDQNYAIFVALGASLVLLHARSRDNVGGSVLRAPLIGLGSALITYAIATGTVFSPRSFADHVEFILFHPGGSSGQSYFSTPATVAGYIALAGEYVRHLADAMGWPMLAASSIGLVVTAVRAPRVLLMALPVVAVFAGVIAPVRFLRIRFVIPAAYTLALFAGAAVGTLASRGAVARAAAVGRTGPLRIAWAAFIVIAGWSFVRGIDLTWQMLNDPRYALQDWLGRNARPGDRVGYYGASLKLPPLEAGIVAEQGPHAEAYPRPEGAGWPEFIVVIPQQQFEIEHEWNLPEERWLELKTGRWEYEPMLALQAASLFARRPINWVNPPTRLFVRRDIVPRLNDARRRLEID